MNYLSVYERLVNKRKALQPTGYFERHHILPKALGGGDEKENIVFLTGREHFIAHMLLAKIHGGRMWLPVIRMKNRKGKEPYTNSRLYEIAKVKWSRWSSENQRGPNHWAYGKESPHKGKKFPERSGENHPNFGKPMPEKTKESLRLINTGSKRTAETKKKMGAWQIGEKNNMHGKKMSQDHKEMLQKKMKEWFLNATPDQLMERAKNRVGQKRSEESKAKMSAAAKGRKTHPNTIAAVIQSNKNRSKNGTN